MVTTGDTIMPRFARWTRDGSEFYGAVTDAGLIDLSPCFPQWRHLRDVVADNGLDVLADAASGHPVSHHPDEVTFQVPIPSPEKILCIGVNYQDRNAEYRDGQAAQAYPSVFIRLESSLVGHLVPLTRPTASQQLDYEGEIVLVIGKAGRHIPQDSALDHVGAITLCNEGSVRDWMRHAKFNVTQGKNFEGTGAIGPWIVPFTSEDQIADIRLQTRVNGEVRQDDRTGRMIFSFRYLISYLSTFVTLAPGDLIVTGTPTGAGARLDPPVWLVPGDIVEVEAEGIGTLRNGVVDETVEEQ